MAEKRYGRYILEDRIAMGGMAEIFRARTATEGFEKRVCIKRILPHFLEDEEFVTMFRDEARTAAKLQHANVVQVFDFGEEDGTLYIVMEFVDGNDLRRVFEAAKKRRGRLEVGEVVQIGIDVCRGLHHAHSLAENGKPLGIVHRDVSPHNILLSRAGEVKVTDFGIARAAERATHTSTGIVKGKVAYMSPEQAQGFPFDHRLDQFALGAVLWEALCGVKLFTGDNDAHILKNVLACDVPRPSAMRKDVPAALDEVLLKALSKLPANRHADMRQMELAFQKVLFSGAIDPSTADVRNIFSRLMEQSGAVDMRRTQIASEKDIAELAHPSSTDSQPVVAAEQDASSTAGSDVFSTSAKAAPAPGPTAQRNAMAIGERSAAETPATETATPAPAPAARSSSKPNPPAPSASRPNPPAPSGSRPNPAAPATDPNAVTVLAKDNEAVITTEPPAPTTSPPLVPTVTALPQLRDLAALEAARHGTPATVSAARVVDDAKPPRRSALPIAAALVAVLVVAALAFAAATGVFSKSPSPPIALAPATPPVPSTAPPPAAPVEPTTTPPATTTPTPATTPPATTPPATAPPEAKPDAATPEVAKPDAATPEVAKPEAAKPIAKVAKATTGVGAKAKIIRVVVRTATNIGGFVQSASGEWIDISKDDASKQVDLAQGQQQLHIVNFQKTNPRTRSVDVEPGEPVVIHFE